MLIEGPTAMHEHPGASARCPVRGEPIAPIYDQDFYADDFIRDPYPHYAAMRALGPVVWLPRHGNFAITRYSEVLQRWLSCVPMVASAFARKSSMRWIAGLTLICVPERRFRLRLR